MWRAIAFANGEWRETEVFSRDGIIASPKAWLDLANEAIAPPYRGLLRHFGLEVELSSRPYIGREAIELWAKDAESENREFNRDSPGTIEAREGALALTWRETLGEAKNPVTLAWHDRSMVMFALTGEEERVLIEYIPSEDDKKRGEFYQYSYATPEHSAETAFEWRGYYGHECAVIDYWQRMRSHGNGYIVSLRGTAGYVAGYVTRRLIGHRGPLYTQDPTRRARSARMSSKFLDVARAVPDLVSLDRTIDTESAVVFVHGTLSCGLQGLKDLYTPEILKSAPPRHVYRFEHDTFASLTDNSSELADLIGRRLNAGKLLIVAHSRGGLVARFAAKLLADNNYPGQVSIYTFGTPHLGTPLVHMGGGVLKALLNVGEYVVGAIPFCSPLVKALGYVYSPNELPLGIGVMDERSQERSTLNALTRNLSLQAWGARFDVNRSASGFGIETTGFLLGSLGNISHDLVVPTASALGGGIGHPVLTCSHTQYFSEPDVRKAIRDFEPPPPPSWLEQSKTRVRGPAAVIDNSRDDVVIIGGVRVPKRKN